MLSQYDAQFFVNVLTWNISIPALDISLYGSFTKETKEFRLSGYVSSTSLSFNYISNVVGNLNFTTSWKQTISKNLSQRAGNPADIILTLVKF